MTKELAKQNGGPVQSPTKALFTFFQTIAKEQPGILFLLVTLILISGFFEGISVGIFLPIIQVLVGTAHPNEAPSRLDQFLKTAGWNGQIHFLLIFMVVVFGIKNIFLYLQKWFSLKASIQFEIGLKKKITSSVFESDWRFYLQEKVGNLLNAVGTEAKFSYNAFQMLSMWLSEAIYILIYCALGLFLSWKTFLFSLIAGAISFYSLKHLIRRSRLAGLESVDLKNQTQSAALEGFGGIKFLKGNRLEGKAKQKLFDLFDRLGLTELRAFRYTAILETLPDFLMACILSGVLYFSYQYLKVPGEYLLVLIMVLYRLNRRLMTLQTVQQRLMVYLPSFEYCRSLIQKAENQKEQTSEKPFEALSRAVELKDVSFKYGDIAILNSVSLSIPKNQITALVGRSGSGKTSILDLILGLLRPQTGSVMVDSQNLNQLNVFTWRQKIAYVSQDAFLFSGSIEENIRFGVDSATIQEVQEAARQAHAHDFIVKTAEGYGSPVGDRGVQLSGGERQRIALARALLRKPELLILDEATSAVDNESERMIHQAIAALRGKSTVLMVAHRLSSIELADMIYVLNEGRIVESGTKTQLLESSQVFSRLYERQSSH